MEQNGAGFHRTTYRELHTLKTLTLFVPESVHVIVLDLGNKQQEVKLQMRNYYKLSHLHLLERSQGQTVL